MEHGKASSWRHHRCRCDLCRKALLDEARVAWALRRIRAGAEPATRIFAGWARNHVAELERAGMTRGEIAQRAGVSPGTISRLMLPSTRRVSRITSDRVRAVWP